MIYPALWSIALLAVPQTAKSAPKPDPVLVSYSLRWTRQDPPASPGGVAPEPVLLQAPTVSATNNDTATFGFQTTGNAKATAKNDSFALSLSPTVEPADNTVVGADGKPAPKSGATVRTLWSLRVADKTFPGGVSRVEMSGAARLFVGANGDAVIAQFSLINPATGLATVYRLAGQVTLGTDIAATKTP